MSLETKIELVGIDRQRKIDVAKESDNYLRAKQNLERMTCARDNIIELIRKNLNLTPFNMEEDIVKRILAVEGETIADVQAECRYKKTPYKAVVEGFENYINGMRFLLSRGQTITGIRKHGSQGYVEARKLITDLGIVAAGNLDATVELNVNPRKIPLPNGTIIIPEGAEKKLSANSIDVLYLIQGGIQVEDLYVKKYKKESGKGVSAGETRITPIGGGNVVAAKTTKRESVDYMDVTRSLINVLTSNKSGKKWDAELPYLTDKNYNFNEKCELLPWYALFYF